MGQFDLREAIARKYHAEAEFVFVYCREAHPDKAFGTLGNAGGVPPGQTHTWEERAKRARSFREQLKVQRHILVDEDGDRSVQLLYGGMDNQLIVIDLDGRLALKMAHTDPY